MNLAKLQSDLDHSMTCVARAEEDARVRAESMDRLICEHHIILREMEDVCTRLSDAQLFLHHKDTELENLHSTFARERQIHDAISLDLRRQEDECGQLKVEVTDAQLSLHRKDTELQNLHSTFARERQIHDAISMDLRRQEDECGRLKVEVTDAQLSLHRKDTELENLRSAFEHERQQYKATLLNFRRHSPSLSAHEYHIEAGRELKAIQSQSRSIPTIISREILHGDARSKLTLVMIHRLD
jgi:chromosome segregation ATPase